MESEGKYVIEFRPEKRMVRLIIEHPASPMGLPKYRVISDSRYFVRRWMTEYLPWVNIKNYALCSVKHKINDRTVAEFIFEE